MATPNLTWMFLSLLPKCCTELHCKFWWRLTEVESAVPTRSNSDRGVGTILDRCSTSLPAHLFTLNKVSHIVEQCLRGFRKSGLSDHAPIATTFHAIAAPSDGPISVDVFKHWTGRYLLEKLAWQKRFVHSDFAHEP